jgi:O-antigen ligase
MAYEITIQKPLSYFAHLILLFAGMSSALFFTGVEGQLFFLSQILLWLFLFFQLLVYSDRIIVTTSPFAILLGLLTTVLLVALFWSPVPGYTQVMVWRHGSVLMLFMGMISIQHEKVWQWLETFIFCLSSALVMYGVLQYLSGDQPKATYLNKNSFAGFLLPVLFWNILSDDKGWVTWRRYLILLGTGLVLGLIGSRGAILAMFFGFACLILLTWRRDLRLRRYSYQLIALSVGFVSSLLLTGLQTGAGRMMTLVDPQAAGSARYYIWKSSWQMFRDAPWHGVGPGLYGLIYPPYRNAVDRTAGHFAHNDLLQILIETGWIGFILCFSLGLSLLWLVFQGLRSKEMTEGGKHEVALLTSGLVAVTFHSMFTFNFYVYSTLLLVAIVLARIFIILPPHLSRLQIINLRKYGRLMSFSPALLCVVPLFILGSCWWSQVSTDRALNAVRNDDTERVAEELVVAKRFWPSNDFNWYMEGELLRLGLPQASHLSAEDKNQLLEQAIGNFSEAMKLNPLRAMTPHKMGLLLETSQPQVDEKRVVELYEYALDIDPMYHPARLSLARIHLVKKDLVRAKQILEDGLTLYYPNTPSLIPYLKIAGDLKRKYGENNQADLIDQRIKKILVAKQVGR